MRLLIAWILLFAACFAPVRAPADGEPAGDFAYFVLALSWSPNWCAGTGRARGADQCRPGNGYGWVLHGLWPQYDRGWPSYCRNPQAPPSRAMTAGMTDIMGSPGLAWHQWKKHGTCSGLDAGAYFALSRRAYAGIVRPPAFRGLSSPVRLPASVVEEAFVKANPGITPEMITVTCRNGAIEEVRLCLTRDLDPRPCGADTRRDCRLTRAFLAPVD